MGHRKNTSPFSNSSESDRESLAILSALEDMDKEKIDGLAKTIVLLEMVENIQNQLDLLTQMLRQSFRELEEDWKRKF